MKENSVEIASNEGLMRLHDAKCPSVKNTIIGVFLAEEDPIAWLKRDVSFKKPRTALGYSVLFDLKSLRDLDISEGV